MKIRPLLFAALLTLLLNLSSGLGHAADRFFRRFGHATHRARTSSIDPHQRQFGSRVVVILRIHPNERSGNETEVSLSGLSRLAGSIRKAGMLLYKDGNFMQVREGPKEAVNRSSRESKLIPRNPRGRMIFYISSPIPQVSSRPSRPAPLMTVRLDSRL
jgi:hypothetical protein